VDAGVCVLVAAILGTIHSVVAVHDELSGVRVHDGAGIVFAHAPVAILDPVAVDAVGALVARAALSFRRAVATIAVCVGIGIHISASISVAFFVFIGPPLLRQPGIVMNMPVTTKTPRRHRHMPHLPSRFYPDQLRRAEGR
jgi:hypothetical protein